LRRKKMNTKIQKVLLMGLCCFIVVSMGAKPIGNRITHGEVMYRVGHYLAGEPIPTGYDPYGYNYHGHMFEGSYANAYLGGDGFPPYDGDDESYLADNPGAESKWYWPYRDVYLQMKWNDAWLSNMDCDGDGLLDRHYGHASYIGSGAWLTNHQSGIENGTEWFYFVKIIAAPADAYKVSGVWHAVDGTEIGPVIWGSFAIIQQVTEEGLEYGSPSAPGLGNL
jgi:hypothetical protein